MQLTNSAACKSFLKKAALTFGENYYHCLLVTAKVGKLVTRWLGKQGR